MKKFLLIVMVALAVSCMEKKKPCPAGPYQVAIVKISGDSLPAEAGFIVTTYNLHNFSVPLDSVGFAADLRGHLAYDLAVSGQYNYTIRCDTLKVRDTIKEVVEVRDDCGNNILSLSFKLNGKLNTGGTIFY
jgi:hypothetical protein